MPCVETAVALSCRLFHDLCDAKYLPANAGPVSAASVISPLLRRYVDLGLIKQEQVTTIFRIVDSVSWSKEEARLERIKRGDRSASDDMQIEWEAGCPEFQCVSDADRLDAIGSIGEQIFVSWHTSSPFF